MLSLNQLYVHPLYIPTYIQHSISGTSMYARYSAWIFAECRYPAWIWNLVLIIVCSPFGLANYNQYLIPNFQWAYLPYSLSSSYVLLIYIHMYVNIFLCNLTWSEFQYFILKLFRSIFDRFSAVSPSKIAPSLHHNFLRT